MTVSGPVFPLNYHSEKSKLQKTREKLSGMKVKSGDFEHPFDLQVLKHVKAYMCVYNKLEYIN